MNDIEKFDPSKLMDGVKDRIKATFVSLIPDEAWDQMLAKEIYIFTTGRIVHHHDTDYQHKDENGNYLRLDWDEKIPYSQLPQKDQWGHPTGKDDISPLQQMIREELTKKFQKDLTGYLDSDEYKTFFDENGHEHIKKTLEDILIKNADTIFVNIISGMMQRGIEQMRHNISSQNIGY